MEFVNNFYETLFIDKKVSTVLSTFLVLYGGLASPQLPGFVKTLFENRIFKILILSLVVYSSNKDPKFAIMMAVAFTITMNMLDSVTLSEKFSENSNICNNFINQETKLLELKESDITEEGSSNWKEMCCCDFKTGNPVLTNACLDKLGDEVNNDDFDYEKAVCN
jgi:hypothetical protein